MAVAEPDDTLRNALRRLGPRGGRAEQMLDSAAEHLSGSEALGLEHAAYALREAVMAIVNIDTGTVPDIKEAARRVVKLHGAGVGDDALARAVEALRQTLEGAGPHDTRLERVVAAWSRTRPTRATGDRLTQLVTALGVANRGLHRDDAPVREAVVAAYTRTCVALNDLFGAVSERLAGMDDLVALDRPGPADAVRLRERLGDGHPLSYLFDRARGPGWLHALRNDHLLRPPPDGPWVAGPYVLRVAESHPAEVRAWLRTLPKDLSPKQVVDLLWVARAAGRDDILTIAVRLAEHRLDSFEVRFQLDALLRQATPEQRASRVARILIEKLLRAMFTGGSWSHDTNMAAEQANAAVAATAGAEPE